MAQFFIGRPVFAWVIAILLMLGGALALNNLPVERYPQVAPPSITIEATYPGATAEAVEEAVTQVIEQVMTGVDNLLYFSSKSSSAGLASLTLTFAAGTDPDIAQVQVQNKLQLATPRLPQAVQDQGIRVTKSSDSFLMVIAFSSSDGSLDRSDIADYVAANVQDEIARISGVGNAQLFGSQYAMRVWLDPIALQAYGLTPSDVIAAIGSENRQVAGGQLGGLPAADGQRLNAPIVVQSLLESPEAFADILLRVDPAGGSVRLGDVARVELGAEDYSISGRFNRKPSAGLGINLASGANALATGDEIRARIAELESFFPAGLEVSYAYDTTPFIRISIEEVAKTLFEGIALVFLVMFLFLQNFRATLVPTIAVPVVLLGTFAVLYAFGYTINTLTMFALVLAIGLLVDDAIVVVENVERVMHEDGLDRVAATRKSMAQITGALIGIAVVLSAVFVPMGFFPGTTGAIYEQFAVTLVTAMALSVLVALTLTPALCATLLKPGDGPSGNGPLARFNRGFEAAASRFRSACEAILSRPLRALLSYTLIVAVLAVAFIRLPTAFLPEEDAGFLLTQVQLPVGATAAQTQAVMGRLEDHFLDREGDAVKSMFAVTGFNFAGQGQNAGLAFIRLHDWEERDLAKDGVQALIGRAMGAFSGWRDAIAFALNPPAIPALGFASGFNFQLLDRGGQGHEALVAARDKLLGAANGSPALSQVRYNGLPDAPQFELDIDREQASAYGVTLEAINETLSIALGSSYVNDFLDRGRIKRVVVQGDTPYRMQPSDLEDWYLRNNEGATVPYSAFASGDWSLGAQQLQRYNGVPAMNVQGNAAPGFSTGDAMAVVEELTASLGEGFTGAWTGLSYEERQAGGNAMLLYGLSMLVVFLSLAALYESWSIPFAVMLVVPLGILGAVLAVTLRGLTNDVFFQVGLLTTVGLSAKNAILIAEFALALQQQGRPLLEATLEATRMRLRPIVMTSLAFMLGVTPLMLSSGAGSGARQALGTSVFGGMLSATALAIFFVPLFFVLIRRIAARRERSGRETAAAPPAQ